MSAANGINDQSTTPCPTVYTPARPGQPTRVLKLRPVGGQKSIHRDCVRLEVCNRAFECFLYHDVSIPDPQVRTPNYLGHVSPCTLTAIRSGKPTSHENSKTRTHACSKLGETNTDDTYTLRCPPIAICTGIYTKLRKPYYEYPKAGTITPYSRLDGNKHNYRDAIDDRIIDQSPANARPTQLRADLDYRHRTRSSDEYYPAPFGCRRDSPIHQVLRIQDPQERGLAACGSREDYRGRV